MSYNLAEIIVRNILERRRDRFLQFLRHAHRGDGGEGAAQKILGASLGDYAVMFLGEGDWAPRPTDAPSFNARGCMRAGMGDYASAIVDFSEAIRLAPEEPEGYFLRALARYENGGGGSALGGIDRALQLSPEDAQAFYLRSRIRAEQADPSGARSDYETAKRLAPNVEEEFRFFADAKESRDA